MEVVLETALKHTITSLFVAVKNTAESAESLIQAGIDQAVENDSHYFAVSDSKKNWVVWGFLKSETAPVNNQQVSWDIHSPEERLCWIGL